MRIHFASIGKLKSGAERELFDRYTDRIAKSGRSLGITMAPEIEIPESRAARPQERKEEEAAALIAAIPEGTVLIALDERGQIISSKTFADRLEIWKDNSAPAVAFLVGGPDGHGQALLEKATLKIALGAMTWPHQIARALIAEQVYRAITIMTGHPYHRE